MPRHCLGHEMLVWSSGYVTTPVMLCDCFASHMLRGCQRPRSKPYSKKSYTGKTFVVRAYFSVELSFLSYYFFHDSP